jgi:hypothetical protein
LDTLTFLDLGFGTLVKKVGHPCPILNLHLKTKALVVSTKEGTIKNVFRFI